MKLVVVLLLNAFTFAKKFRREEEVASGCGNGIEWESPKCLAQNARLVEEAKSVGRISQSQGGRKCTAFKIKDKTSNRNALFMTANHCYGDGNIMYLQIHFKYEERTCNNNSSVLPLNHWNSLKIPCCGFKNKVANSSDKDWAVYEVDDQCAYANTIKPLEFADNVGHAGDGIYLIGHPHGEPMIVCHKESHDNCELRPSLLGGNFISYYCDTKGGMPGSPVFNTLSGKVIGVHTHGGCQLHKKNVGTGVLNFQSDLASHGINFHAMPHQSTKTEEVEISDELESDSDEDSERSSDTLYIAKRLIEAKLRGLPSVRLRRGRYVIRTIVDRTEEIEISDELEYDSDEDFESSSDALYIAKRLIEENEKDDQAKQTDDATEAEKNELEEVIEEEQLDQDVHQGKQIKDPHEKKEAQNDEDKFKNVLNKFQV